MMHRIAILTLAVLLSAGVAQAAQTTAILNVHHAYCELCPSIVTKSLKGVPGVKTVEVTKANKAGDMTATVTFDDATASVPALVTATTIARPALSWSVLVRVGSRPSSTRPNRVRIDERIAARRRRATAGPTISP